MYKNFKKLISGVDKKIRYKEKNEKSENKKLSTEVINSVDNLYI